MRNALIVGVLMVALLVGLLTKKKNVKRVVNRIALVILNFRDRDDIRVFNNPNAGKSIPLSSIKDMEW